MKLIMVKIWNISLLNICFYVAIYFQKYKQLPVLYYVSRKTVDIYLSSDIIMFYTQVEVPIAVYQ